MGVLPALAAACPVCHTALGAQVRAGLLDGLGVNLLATLAPFPVLGLVVVAVHLGWTRRP
jgi:hypothetical protein